MNRHVCNIFIPQSVANAMGMNKSCYGACWRALLPWIISIVCHEYLHAITSTDYRVKCCPSTANTQNMCCNWAWICGGWPCAFASKLRVGRSGACVLWHILCVFQLCLESLCVTMFVRLKVAGWEICRPCPDCAWIPCLWRGGSLCATHKARH